VRLTGRFAPSIKTARIALVATIKAGDFAAMSARDDRPGGQLRLSSKVQHFPRITMVLFMISATFRRLIVM
jgi:hypothetical protein